MRAAHAYPGPLDPWGRWVDGVMMAEKGHPGCLGRGAATLQACNQIVRAGAGGTAAQGRYR